MINNTGGSAFPHEYFDKQLNQGRVMHGMTLRDYFAAKAMQGMMANSVLMQNGTFHDGNFKAAYEAADAMLKAREA